MKFNEILKKLRKEHKVSQEKLASYLGITRSAIGNYEQGLREPDFETMEMIADYFNVDIAYLLGKQSVPKIISLNLHSSSSAMIKSLDNMFMPREDDLPITLGEMQLLRAYRKADDVDKETILRLLGLSNGKKKKVIIINSDN